ncbi:MAG: pyruvate dehydrogenase complex E1 component subunit beta [Bacteroidia bacterium]|nr:pyruvate dehydrogenase complex E1 component subunit beta [Bacteroidia bacterium]MDW8347767.1 pyruvate dehydrogenase complex E1 component subunit beta [Bacteroidia bacterium]
MREITFREALREALREEMHRDPLVFLMGEEVAEYNGAYKVSEGLLKEFGPERVIDTPISELGFAGIGVGAAMAGLRPVIEFMTFNFSLVAIDQVINSAAKIMSMSGGQFNIPIVFRGPSGSAGQLGAQHSQCFESWYANCPGLKVVSPSTPADGKGLLKAAIRDNDPVIVMESELMYSNKGPVPDPSEGDFIIPIGKADIKRHGKDVSLITFGKMVHVCLAAAKQLEDMGIDAEVLDLRSLRPLDNDAILATAKKTNRVVIVEESWPLASISSEVGFLIQNQAFDYLDAPIMRVMGGDVPLPYAPTLIDAYLPNPTRVIDAVKKVMYIK